jgi:hypothetical protein
MLRRMRMTGEVIPVGGGALTGPQDAAAKPPRVSFKAPRLWTPLAGGPRHPLIMRPGLSCPLGADLEPAFPPIAVATFFPEGTRSGILSALSRQHSPTDPLGLARLPFPWLPEHSPPHGFFR